MTKTLPKSGLIAKESNRLSVITEQDIEESYPTEQEEKKSREVPITKENAYRLDNKADIQPLPFKKVHREMSFASKKLRRPVKTSLSSKVSSEPLSTSMNSGGQTEKDEIHSSERRNGNESK